MALAILLINTIFGPRGNLQTNFRLLVFLVTKSLMKEISCCMNSQEIYLSRDLSLHVVSQSQFSSFQFYYQIRNSDDHCSLFKHITTTMVVR